MALLNCQENIVVPEIVLNFDPLIKVKCQEAVKNNKELKVVDFEAHLNDDKFIASLVYYANKWI